MSHEAVTTSLTAQRRSSRAGHGPFRTDIQSLRALAIAAVVLNHLWPLRMTGGYVGVDVFFVISGFLITGHLFGEIGRTGRVGLGAFYARRIRRLLPAALLVLLVGAGLVALFLPYPRWERNAIEIASSALYVENWFLAAMSVNYSALNDSASVAQHYWSLSVEEQFYLIWPILMLAAVVVRVRTPRVVSRRRRVLLALSLIACLSFAASVLYTDAFPSQAYFVTFTRAWEFAVGGLVALAAHRLTLSRASANVLAAGGFAAIFIALFAFGDHTPFPGAAALVPVLGTAAIIAAGSTHVPLFHARVTASRPIQWLGGVSYSLYLWHWPLIVIAPLALGAEPSAGLKLGILILALILAAATKVLVEDVGQRWNGWATVPRSLAGMFAAIAIVIVAATALMLGAAARAASEAPEAPLPSGACVGPDAIAGPRECADRFDHVDSPMMTAKNEYFYTPPECGDFHDELAYGDKRTTRVCDYSGGSADAEEVWLIGDSHAQQWQGAIFDLARERKWKLTLSLYGGCPPADVAFVGFRGDWGQADIDQCRRWARELADAVAAAAPDVVLTSMAARLQHVDDGTSRPEMDQFADGLLRDWSRWSQAGSEVLVIIDTPLNAEVRAPDCLLLNSRDPIRCARPRAEALPTDPLAVAIGRNSDPHVAAIDLTDRFCDADRCYAAIGGMPVYFDGDHLNREYVRMLAPTIGAAIDQAAAGGAR